MEQKYLTVTQLNTYIKRVVDSEELLKNISICGEVSGYSVSRNIAYFSLKDENSLISVVMFDASDKYMPENGESVVLTGSLNYYLKGGKISFNAFKIEKFGIGKLYEQFLQLKEKLQNEGLFDNNRKKPLPQKIKRVGVVTSKTGAVIQDIKNVGFRRNKNIEIVLYPVKVQGEGAEIEISKAIEFFDNYNVDVIIVARGGGSSEDLQPFNTEIVARVVSRCNKVVVSAVGHETDFTIIDFVADLRAPTPSAAAELVFDDMEQFKQRLKTQNIRLNNSINYILDNALNKLNITNNKIHSELNIMLAKKEQIVHFNKNKIENLCQNLVANKNLILMQLTEKLNSLNPDNIFKLGYGLIKKDSITIKSVNQIENNDTLTLFLKDGKAKVNVIEKE